MKNDKGFFYTCMLKQQQSPVAPQPVCDRLDTAELPLARAAQ
jgi:hypothetical protein